MARLKYKKCTYFILSDFFKAGTFFEKIEHMDSKLFELSNAFYSNLNSWKFLEIYFILLIYLRVHKTLPLTPTSRKGQKRKTCWLSRQVGAKVGWLFFYFSLLNNIFVCFLDFVWLCTCYIHYINLVSIDINRKTHALHP